MATSTNKCGLSFTEVTCSSCATTTAAFLADFDGHLGLALFLVDLLPENDLLTLLFLQTLNRLRKLVCARLQFVVGGSYRPRAFSGAVTRLALAGLKT